MEYAPVVQSGAPLPPIHSFAEVQSIQKQKNELIQSRSAQVVEYKKAEEARSLAKEKLAKVAEANQQKALDLTPMASTDTSSESASPNGAFTDFSTTYVTAVVFVALLLVIIFGLKKGLRSPKK